MQARSRVERGRRIVYLGGVGTLTEPWLLLTWGMLGALALGVWLWARRFQTRTSTASLQVLARLTLEPRRTLYVVRIAERVVVVAASEGGLRQLLELSREEGRSFDPTARASDEE